MTNAFANMSTDGLEKTGDSLGGSYGILPTSIRSGIITMAYALQSARGAHAMYLEVDLEGHKYRETIYVTNAKGENYYVKSDDPKKKMPMPGFLTVNDICMLAAEVPLAEMDFQEKVVNVWDKEERKELPKAMMVAVGLLQKPISLAITKNLENKSDKNEATGEYEPNAEEIEKNYIAKAFHTESKLTLSEAEAGLEEGVFWDKWLERNPEDKVFDKRKYDAKKQGAGGRPSAVASKAAPVAGAASAPKAKSLFGKKS